MNERNFFAELKRRNVYKVAAAYAVVAWLLMQVASQIFPFFEIPNWVVRLVVLLLIIGFPIALIIAWAFELTPEGLKRTEAADAMPTQPPMHRTWIYVVVVAGAISVGLFFIGRSITLRTSLGENGRPPASAGALPSKSIAVLPFDNLSEDKATAYFVAGMRDEILTKLAQLQDLNVVSRTSTDKFQSHPEDVRSVSRELNVAHVLEGSVQKSGDDVLINLRLIDARNDNHLWAQSYRRSFSHIFDVEAEVASEVVDALNIRLAPAEAERLRKAATENSRAHDLFLRARALNSRSDEQSFRQAITLLEQAVKEDPGYAAAWAQIASIYVGIADAYSAPINVLDPMRHAALQAVRADEKAGAGHVWLGAVALLYDRNFPVAKRELERAVVLDPNSPDAHLGLGVYLARIEGNFVSARGEVQRARTLDPLNPWPVWFEIGIALAEGNYGDALGLAREVLAIDPHFFYEIDPLAHVYGAMGHWDQAVKRYESLPADLLRRPNFELAVAYAHTGRTEDARRILADLETLATKVYIDKVHVAAIYAALGDHDHAFAALRQAAADRSATVSAPRFNPLLAPLFDDPRFAQFEYDIAHSAIVLPADA